jgi:hypothetical protein
LDRQPLRRLAKTSDNSIIGPRTRDAGEFCWHNRFPMMLAMRGD